MNLARFSAKMKKTILLLSRRNAHYDTLGHLFAVRKFGRFGFTLSTTGIVATCCRARSHQTKSPSP